MSWKRDWLNWIERFLDRDTDGFNGKIALENANPCLSADKVSQASSLMQLSGIQADLSRHSHSMVPGGLPEMS